MRTLTILLLTFAGFSFAANAHNTKLAHRTDYMSNSKIKQPPDNLHEKTYVECDISLGSLDMCYDVAEAKRFPVRQDDGTYNECDISLGNLDMCYGVAEAKRFPVRQDDGTYNECDISLGNLDMCYGVAEAKRFPVEKKYTN